MSLEAKIKKSTAKSIIGQTRNYFLAAASINSLPSEILAHIFHLVAGSRPCGVGDRGGEIITFPKYPDILSHVCSHWRDIATGMPTLWTHIDYVPRHSLSAGFEARAKLFATRSGSLHLDIHIYEPVPLQLLNCSNILRFITTIVSRIRSIELVMPGTAIPEDDLYVDVICILEQCLRKPTPGTLTKLTLTDLRTSVPTFIEAASELAYVSEGNEWLNVPPDDLEVNLLPLTVLRLDGIYLPWAHPVYHELIELCLTSTQKPAAKITKSELVNILIHSPGLRVLHFGLKITNQLKDTYRTPVRLEHLEELNLTSMDYKRHRTLLRLLAPGPKPLQLSIQLDDASSNVYEDEVIEFFKRSNVTRLHATAHPEGSENISIVDELIRPLSQLRVLVLEKFYWLNDGGPPAELTGYDTSEWSKSRLDALYILECKIESNLLLRMIKQHPVKALTLRNCHVSGASNQPLNQLMHQVCPVVSVGTGGSNPIEIWDRG